MGNVVTWKSTESKTRVPRSVSLVINTYNRAKSLRVTLESMNWLRHPRFEVIVVNGPSTDATAGVIKQFQDRIRTAECPQANLSVSRNIGLAMASGEIVAFIDDDAVPEPDWLDELCKVYEDPSVGAVGGFIRNHTGFDFQCKVIACDRFGDSQSFESVAMALHSGAAEKGAGAALFLSPTGANSSFRRKALESIGGFDEEFAYFLEETDAALRLIDHGWKVAYAPCAEVHHKYAESHLRNADLIPRNMHIPLRSKAYFCTRHALPQYGLSKVINYLSDYRIARRRDKQWLRDNHLISHEHHDRLVSEISSGTEAGVASGLRFPRGRIPYLPNRSESFQNFPTKRALKERLRLCLVSQDFPPGPAGGIGVFTHALAKSLAGRGHEISVVTRGKDFARVDFEDGIWVHRVPHRLQSTRTSPKLPDLPLLIKSWAYCVYDEVLRIRARRGLDLIYAPIWDVEAAACAADVSLPVVTSLQSTYKLVLPSKSKWLTDAVYRQEHVDKLIAAESWLLGRSARIIASSEAILHDIESQYGMHISRDRVRIIPYGLDPVSAAALPPEIFCKILFVGRFETRKGVDILADAIPDVLKLHPNTTFVFVGDTAIDEDGRGPLLRRRIEELCVRYPGRIKMLGILSREDLTQQYASADIFVAPSRYESFGLIFLEAMMQGKCCVGTAVGGIPEVVQDGVTGLLVPPQNAPALATALIRLVGDSDLRDRLGKAGKSVFFKQFTSDQMAQQVEQEFSSLLGRAVATGR